MEYMESMMNDRLEASISEYEQMSDRIKELESSKEEMLKAMRRAVLALAFAAESSAAMKDDYHALSKAIEKANEKA